MKVVREICPNCNLEIQHLADEDDLRTYTEEIVPKVCGAVRCQAWKNSPEQRLLRALFGVKEE